MPAAPESSLDERRRLLRAQLRTQREAIALQLAGGTRRDYPRSITMRLLLYRPALAVGLVSALAGARVARRVHALTIVVRVLTAVAALAPEPPVLPPGEGRLGGSP